MADRPVFGYLADTNFLAQFPARTIHIRHYCWNGVDVCVAIFTLVVTYPTTKNFPRNSIRTEAAKPKNIVFIKSSLWSNS